MISSSVLGIILALASTASWGSGDFSGGFATRSQNQFRVLFLTAIPGIVILALIALTAGEPVPSTKNIAWALAAGLAGAMGTVSLYRGLSTGSAATVAPAAGVIGAGLPVAFSIFFIGAPGVLKLAGFAVAIAGIWLVSRPDGGFVPSDRGGLMNAVLAGTGFGLFFILIAQVEQGLVFGPLVCSKTAALALAAVIIVSRREQIPSLTASPIALLAGVFDAGGNAFYMLARQFTRLDVAAVLSSMYPAVTVVLSCLILKEKVSASQWRGVALCVLAIALISA
ncbi:MAG TPA: DMT family transporter [Deltaproteobacteria bacterium]|nr:DMT family transporter [Deltaproteobacteria bacterium]